MSRQEPPSLPSNISILVSACTGRGAKIAISGPSMIPMWLAVTTTGPRSREPLGVEDADVVPPPDDPPRRRAAAAEQPPVRVPDDIAARPLEMSGRAAHGATSAGAVARPTTRSTTSSRVRSVVSMWTAPSAIVSGATARPESIRSRLSRDSWVAVTSVRAGLGRPACGAGGRVGGEEDLQPGGRPDDRTDVAALDHDPAGADDVPLQLDQPRADRRDRAHGRDRGVDGVGADLDGDVHPVEGDRRAAAGRCRTPGSERAACAATSCTS